jgi:hypothetical protein
MPFLYGLPRGLVCTSHFEGLYLSYLLFNPLAGPISLLVTTTATHSSSQNQKLLEKLSNLKAHLPVEVAQSLSLHILYVSPKSNESPNACLNLARLFSQTDHVMLFPGNLSVLPPPMLFKTLLSYLQREPGRLTIINNQNDTMFHFPSLTPALVSNRHSIWCTERFFLSSSRDLDWDACLWQLWLDSLGDVANLWYPGWKHGEQVVWRMNSASVSPSTRVACIHTAGWYIEQIASTVEFQAQGWNMRSRWQAFKSVEYRRYQRRERNISSSLAKERLWKGTYALSKLKSWILFIFDYRQSRTSDSLQAGRFFWFPHSHLNDWGRTMYMILLAL